MSEVIDKKEKLLLEWLIADRASLVKAIKIIEGEYFQAPLDRVAGFIKEYFLEYHGAPSVDLVEAETGVKLKARHIDESERSYLLDEVEEHCQKQGMAKAVMESVNHIEEGNLMVVQELVRKALMIKLDTNLGIDIFENPYDRITSFSDAIDSRTIGIAAIDDLLGTVNRGEMYLFYAASGVGKSITLGNIGWKMALQGLNVAIISLELTDLLYAKRMDTIITGEDIGRYIESAEEISETLNAEKDNMGSIILKRMRARSTVEDIRLYLSEYHLEKGYYPDVLIVDYLTIMGTVQKHSGKFDEHEEIAHTLRDLGNEMNMYVFSAGQVNREGQDVMRITPAHCAGGISVIQASDAAVALSASEEDLDNNQMQASQLKIRNNGKTTKSNTLYLCPKSLRLSDKPSGSIKVNPSTSPVAGFVNRKKEEPKNDAPSLVKKKPEPKPTKASVKDSMLNNPKLKAAFKVAGAI